MRPRVLSRLMLCALLFIQLGTVSVASPADRPAVGEEHAHGVDCARQHRLIAGHPHEATDVQPRQSGFTADGYVNSFLVNGSGDCCRHSTCSCDCAATVPLSMTTVSGSPVVPDHPAVLGFAAPVFDARVFEFFRPPI